eukprot:Em0010g555a
MPKTSKKTYFDELWLKDSGYDRSKELHELLDIIKEHDKKGVLEKDETESSTVVIMEQMEGLLTGTSKSSHGLSREQFLLFMYPLLHSTRFRGKIYNISQLVHKFAAFNAFKDGLVLQAKPKTGNLMMFEPSSINEQVQGVRPQIDSHPPPLLPVEEEMHTKPSQHAYVHIDEDVEMSPVGLMDQVPRPLDELLDQQAMVAVNVAVGGEQASMDEAMIEVVQGQGQMVEQCGDVMVVEADNSVVALCKAYFGPGPGCILLDNAIEVQNREDVGVRCRVVFVESDIRLTLGSEDRGDQYVTICADTWSNIEASCQQPGYPPYVAITVVKGVLGGTTNSISSISGFACNGAEPSLSACPVVTGASVPCSLATSGQLRDVAKAGNCTHGDISEQVTSREVVCKQLNASEPNIRVNATGQHFFFTLEELSSHVQCVYMELDP